MAAHLAYGLGLTAFTMIYFKLLEKEETESKSTSKNTAKRISNFAPEPARKVKIFHIKSEKEEKFERIKKFMKPRKI